MSLVSEQSIFLLQVGELIRKAHELGFVVTGGELYRTPEQQALYMKNGRSKTMDSQHLKRLAVDLNFFKEDADGGLALTYDADALRPLGQYWESLDSSNRWGGNWSSFKDTPHFERRPASAVEAPSVSTAGAVEAIAEVAGVAGRAVGGSASRGGAGLLAAAVGARCPNQRDDVETVQRILNLSLEAGKIALDAPLSTDGAFGGKTLAAISAFQRAALGETEPDGVVSVKGATWSALCDFLPTVDREAFMALLYLRAAEADASGFHASLLATMKQRGIDSPLRIAHFLAQLGHESGELRFHEEIASGKAYEGRADLGNTRSGDGPRFKGRGLIQLTGRANYESYGKAIGRKDEILAQPTLIATDPALCVDVAGWYWETRKINPLADRDDLIAVTKKINGGTNGLDDRRRLLVRAKGLLGIG